MARCDNWPRALAEFIEERRAQPFVWGKHDCCLFVADWVQRLTGIDAAKGLRGKYTTAAGAARVIKRKGGLGALVGGLCAKHGWPAVRVQLAQRGDVLLVDTPAGEALAICLGAQAAAAGPEGLTMLPTLTALGAWRVD